MWLISDDVLKVKDSSLLHGYLPSVRCIFGNGICPFQVVPWNLFLLICHDFISKLMVFKLHFAPFPNVAYFVYISEIFVNMTNWMELSNKAVFPASTFVAITIWLDP